MWKTKKKKEKKPKESTSGERKGGRLDIYIYSTD